MLHVGCNPEETEAVLVVPVIFNNKSPGADFNIRYSVGRGDSPIFPLSKSAQVVGVVELFRFPGGVRGPFNQKDEDVRAQISTKSRNFGINFTIEFSLRINSSKASNKIVKKKPKILEDVLIFCSLGVKRKELFGGLWFA